MCRLSPISSPVRSTTSRSGMLVHRADHLDAMAHDVENAAAAQPRRLFLIDKDDRHRDRDLRSRPDPLEVDMQRRVGYRVVLHLARQRAVRRAVDADLDNVVEEPGPRQNAGQLARLEADRHRLLVVAVDDCGDAPGAPRRARRALAGPRSRLGAEADHFGHFLSLLYPGRTSRAHACRSAPLRPTINRTGSRPNVPR